MGEFTFWVGRNLPNLEIHALQGEYWVAIRSKERERIGRDFLRTAYAQIPKQPVMAATLGNRMCFDPPQAWFVNQIGISGNWRSGVAVAAMRPSLCWIHQHVHWCKDRGRLARGGVRRRHTTESSKTFRWGMVWGEGEGAQVGCGKAHVEIGEPCGQPRRNRTIARVDMTGNALSRRKKSKRPLA